MGWWMNNQSRRLMAGTGWIDSTDDRHGLRALATGVLPLMLNEGLLTLHEGNLAASAITLAIGGLLRPALSPPG